MSALPVLTAEIVRLRKQLREVEACAGRAQRRLAAILEEAEGREDGAPDSTESERAWGRVAAIARGEVA